MFEPFSLRRSPKPTWKYRLSFLLSWTLALNYGCVGQMPKALSIASGSMEPTLEVKDRIYMTPATYNDRSPQRGDIVTFTPPPAMAEINPVWSDDILILSRVVGLPGETFEVSEGQTLINQVPLQEPYVKAPAAYTLEPVVIPEDAYVVLGDNRNNAFDSIAWGFLPEKNITGKVQIIYWPPGRFGAVYD